MSPVRLIHWKPAEEPPAAIVRDLTRSPHDVRDLCGRLADKTGANDQHPITHAQLCMPATAHGNAGHVQKRGLSGSHLFREPYMQTVLGLQTEFRMIMTHIEQIADS